jgi:hypothetical protein
MWTCVVMKEHYTRYQHSMPLVLNGPTQIFSVWQYTSDITEIPCCMNFTISFLADVCLNFFGFQDYWVSGLCPSSGILKSTFLACLVNVCASPVLTALWFEH